MVDIPGLKRNVVLAPYTTYKIGGPADYFIEVKNADALARIVLKARELAIPYFILGCGANILVRDKGFRGLVIHNKADKIEFLENNQVKAESGAIMTDLIEQCLEKELSGLEHFIEIPSTVGGAIWQNLHFLSPDRSRTIYIEEIVETAHILDEVNKTCEVDQKFFKFGYDDSILHHRNIVVLDVLFQLKPQSKQAMKNVIEANIAWRHEKQPQLTEYPSCGSVFKKIEGVGAGRLVDQAGLKGTIIGDAQISPKHANYIVNLGSASASDVIDLMELAQMEVKRKFGYQLEPEITIIGEK